MAEPRFFYSDTRVFPIPDDHRFPIGKYAALRRLLAEEGVVREDQTEPAPLAEPEQLIRAHDRGYIEGFFDGSLDARALRRIGLPWSPEFVLRSRASVGGTIAAGHRALETGLAGNMAGGTHHASRDVGEGFCVFNDIVVAAFDLLDAGRVERIGVVDLDVHQGNGTNAIVGSDDRFFLLDMYGRRNYPFRKVPATLDIPLEEGMSDATYLALLAEALPRLLSFGPDIIFYQAGVDVLADDRLGTLELTHDGVRDRDRMVIETAREYEIPIVLTLGGGYSRPIDATVEAYANTWRVATALVPEGSCPT